MRVNQYKLASYIIFISPCTNLSCKLGRFYLWVPKSQTL